MTWACGIALLAWRLEWSGVTVQSLCLETQSIGWILVSEGEGAWEALAWCQGMTQEGGRAWGGATRRLGGCHIQDPCWIWDVVFGKRFHHVMLMKHWRVHGKWRGTVSSRGAPIKGILPREPKARIPVGGTCLERTIKSCCRARHRERVLVLWERSGYAKRTFA